MKHDKRRPVPRLFFQAVQTGNLEKAAEYLGDMIEQHLTRYAFNEDNLTIYITSHLLLTMDLCNYLDVSQQGMPIEVVIQEQVHLYPLYDREPNSAYRLALAILGQVGAFSGIDPFRPRNGDTDVASKSENYSGMIHAICNYVESHRLEEDISVANVAEHFSLSVSYLSRLFKEQTGVRLGNYILNMKYHEANRLLRTTDLPISEIATRCGFTSCSAFIRSYRSKEGITPGAYRRQQGTN